MRRRVERCASSSSNRAADGAADPPTFSPNRMRGDNPPGLASGVGVRPSLECGRTYQRFEAAETDVRSRRTMASLEQAARQMPQP